VAGEGKTGLVAGVFSPLQNHVYVSDALNQTMPPPPQSSPAHFTLQIQVYTEKNKTSLNPETV